MKNFLQKIWAAMCAVPQKNLWLFILGMFLCFLIGILLPKFAEWPIVPLYFFGGIIYFFVMRNAEKQDFLPLIWYAAGVLVPQIIFWIA